jgi:RNA polymerase sigma factor (sigma-70 family)
MIITDKQYKHWFNLSKIICNNNEEIAGDILQDLLIVLIEKGLPTEKVNDNYIFMSLKNRFLLQIKKENKLDRNDQPETPYNEEERDEIQLDRLDNELHQEGKLKAIEDVVLKLPSYEQILYTLHFIHGVSQRQIAKRTGLHLNIIHYRVKTIKNKIVEHYNTKINK